MINLEKYSFNDYSRTYVRQFYNEKNRLKKIFPDAIIEHVGSSSVPNLGGKGIVDIAVAVNKRDISHAIKTLQYNDYEYRPNSKAPDRWFFQRIIVRSGIERRIHIQLTYDNSDSWRSMIAVRDYLRKHRDVAEKYASIKKEAVIRAKGEGKEYREYKHSFLDRIKKLALKEFSK